MKSNSILFVASILAMLMCGCELYNKRGKQPESDPAKVDVLAKYLTGDYYGDYFGDGRGNYCICLSSSFIMEDGGYLPNKAYYILDLVAALSDTEDDMVQVPMGIYILDSMGSSSKHILSDSSYLILTDSHGNIAEKRYFDTAQLRVYELSAGLTATIGGEEHIVTYGGATKVVNRSENGVLSTLVDNYTLVLDNHTLYYYALGDYYGTGLNNYMLLLMPNDNSGDVVQLDVMTSADEGFCGSYKKGDTQTQWSILDGVLNDYYMDGSWYYTSDYKSAAPFKAGRMTISEEEDGTMSVAMYMLDDLENSINGTWRGRVEEYAY